MNQTPLHTVGGIVVLVFAVWVIYLLIEVARHVNAWPFA